jgi:hypothetical protein
MAAGGFIPYPWGKHSSGSTSAAVFLWAVGFVLILLSFVGQELSRSTEEKILTVSERRAEFKDQVTAARERGERINRTVSADKLYAEWPDWQNSTSDLLANALDDEKFHQWFIQLGQDTNGELETPGLGRQVRYLSEILRMLNQIAIRQTWNG